MTNESRYCLDLNQYILHTIKARMLTKNSQYTGKLVIFSQLWSCCLILKKKSQVLNVWDRNKTETIKKWSWVLQH